MGTRPHTDVEMEVMYSDMVDHGQRLCGTERTKAILLTSMHGHAPRLLQKCPLPKLF